MTLDTLDLIQPATAAACPYLGMEFDDSTRCAYPTAVHRCFRPAAPLPVTEDQQIQFCLTDGYTACALFQNPPAVQDQRRQALLHRLRLPAAVLVGIILLGGAVLGARFFIGTAGDRPAPAASTVGPLPPGHQTHTVRPGDTLRSVSDFFGVHPDDVATLNRLPPSGALVPGTTLVLPPQQPPVP